MKTKEAYVHKMAKDLREWSKTIDEFEALASRASIGLQADYEQGLRNLKEGRDLLSSKLRALRESTGSWTGLETDIETAKHGLKDAFDSAREAVKKAA